MMSIDSETAASRSAAVTSFATTAVRIIQESKGVVDYKMIRSLAGHLTPEMLYKLRLDNSTDIIPRLNHFAAVCNYAIVMKAVTIEGYPTVDYGDEDLIIWDGKTMTAVDVTFDPSMMLEKKRKLEARNPNMASEVWLANDRLVMTVDLPERPATVFNPAFKLAKLMNESSDADLEAFIAVADRIADESVRSWNLEAPLLNETMMSMYTTTALKWFAEPTLKTAFTHVASSSYASATVSSWLNRHTRDGPFLNHAAAASDVITLATDGMTIAELALKASMTEPDGLMKCILTNGAIVEDKEHPKGFLKHLVNSTMLADNVACVFRKTEKFLQALFNPTVVKDGNYTDAVVRKKGLKTVKAIDPDVMSEETAELYDTVESEFMTYMVEALTHDSKTATKLAMLSEDIVDTKDNIKKSFIMGFIKALSKMRLVNMIELTAATSRSLITASMAKGPSNSIIVKKIEGMDAFVVAWKTGSLDKFKTVPYVLAYKAESYKASSLVRSHTVINGDYITTGFQTADRRLIASRIRMVEQFLSVSFLFAELDQQMVMRNNINCLVKEMFNIAATMYVNNDLHAQMIEKYRYMMVNAYDRNANVDKVFTKLSIAMPKTIYEKSVILKMITSHAAVKYGFMANAEVLRAITYDYETPFTGKVHTFDKLVNLIYMRNLYNKFRTDGTMSAALVYADLLDEEEEFKRASESDVNGMTKAMMTTVMESKSLRQVINYLRENVAVEAEFMNSCSNSERFKFNAVMVAAAGAEFKYTDDTIDMFRATATGNMLEYCSMKGAMSAGPIISAAQSCRSAEAIITHIAEELAPTNTVLGISELNNCSLYALKLVQSFKKSVQYACRITPKDQVGNREISVLNAEARIGVAFTEGFFKAVAKLSSTDVLNKPNKAEIFLKMIVDDKDVDTVYDSNDQSRWGPNTNMSFLSIATSCFTRKAPTLFNLIMDTHVNMANKLAKAPEMVLDLLRKKSVVISKKSALSRAAEKMMSLGLDTCFRMEWGMFQGIMHQESSTAHDLMCHRANKISTAVLNVKMQHLVTSDDCFRIIKKTEDTMRIEIANYIAKIMSTMNAIRNTGKSCLSEVMGEFNSLFVFRKSLAVPSIKNRYALIDCSTGGYPISDIMNAANSGSVAMSTGDSEAGADMISLCNMLLVLDSYGLFKKYIDKQIVALGRVKLCSIASVFFKPYASLAESIAASYDTDTAIKLLYPMLDLRATANAEVDLNRKDGVASEAATEFFIKPAIANWVNQKLYPKHMMSFAKNVKLRLIYDTAPYDSFDPTVATGKNFLFHFANTFIWASLDDTNFDFCRRYGEGYMSKTKQHFKNIATGKLASLDEVTSMTAAELTSDVVIPENKGNKLLKVMIRDTVVNYQAALHSVMASERSKWFIPEFLVTKGIKSVDIMKKSVITTGFMKRSVFETVVAENGLMVDNTSEFYEPIDFAREFKVNELKEAYRIADNCASMISGLIKPSAKVCGRTMNTSRDPAVVLKDLLFSNRFYYDRRSEVIDSVTGISFSNMPASSYLSTLSTSAAEANKYMSESVWTMYARKEVKLSEWKETAIVDNVVVFESRRVKDHYVDSDVMAVNMAVALITAPNKVNKSFIKSAMAFKMAYKLPPKKCVGRSSVTNYYGKVMMSYRRGLSTFPGYHYSVYDGNLFKHFVIMEDSFPSGTIMKFSQGNCIKSNTYLGMGREFGFDQTTQTGAKDIVFLTTINKWVMTMFDPATNVVCAANTLPIVYIYPEEPEKNLLLAFDADHKVNTAFLRENIGNMEKVTNEALDAENIPTIASAIRITPTDIDYARKCASEIRTMGAYTRMKPFMGSGDDMEPISNVNLAEDWGVFDESAFDDESDSDTEIDLISAFHKAAAMSSDDEEEEDTKQSATELAEATTIFSYKADEKGNNSIAAVRGMRLYSVAKQLLTMKASTLMKLSSEWVLSYKTHVIALFLFVANADISMNL